MTSPALQWGHGDMLKREPAFAGQHPTFAKRIFLSVGSDEYPMMASVMWQFASQLCNSFSRRTYKGMHLIAESIAGEPHGSPVHHLHAMRARYPADSTKPMLPGAVRDCEP